MFLVDSYLTTGETIDGKKLDLPKFVHYIDKQLIQTNNIAVGFDDTKIPNYKEVFTEK